MTLELSHQEIVITTDQINLIRNTIAKDATNEELQLYFYDCKRRGVHPLDKLIHFTKRKGKYTPVTGIDFLRSKAAQTNEYAGSDDALFQMAGAEMVSATVTVYRFVQGQRCPFTATARWAEYYPGGVDASGKEIWAGLWDKMPHTMLAKCAEALALRKGFPVELGGLYTREEMDQAGAEDRQPTAIQEFQGSDLPTHEPPVNVISAAQGKLLFAKAKEAKIEFSAVAAHIKETYGVNAPAELPRNKFNEVLKWLDTGGIDLDKVPL